MLYEGRSFNCGSGVLRDAYEMYPCFIHFNRLMCSPLTERSVDFLDCVDTEQWHCQEHFTAHIHVWRDCLSVKLTGKGAQVL